MMKPKWQYSAPCYGNTHVRISFLSPPHCHHTRYAFNVCGTYPHTHKHSLLGSEFQSLLCNKFLPSYSTAMKSANCKQGPHTISHSIKLTRLFLDQILCNIPCVSSRQHSVLISRVLFCKYVFAVNSIAMNLLQSASKVPPYHKPTAAGSQGILLLFLDQILCKIPCLIKTAIITDAQQIIHLAGNKTHCCQLCWIETMRTARFSYCPVMGGASSQSSCFLLQQELFFFCDRA